jgi:crossover junction endodeoxyribonuclease RuvC
MKILGIDPGTATTGFSIVESQGNKFHCIEYGTIKTSAKDSLDQRLKILFQGLKKIIKEHKPDHFVIENIFFSENVKTALILGHTRGALIAAGTDENIPFFEYSPREIKQATVGKGNASKEQVQYMVRVLLNLKEVPKPADAADACAVALCHFQKLKYRSLISR